MYDLEGQLEQAIAEASVGEFDGHEFGEGECVFYIYGEDADQLFQTIEPILKATAASLDGYAIKRFGEASVPNSRETRVTW